MTEKENKQKNRGDDEIRRRLSPAFLQLADFAKERGLLKGTSENSGVEGRKMELKALVKEYRNKLIELGEKLGFKSECEWKVPGGEIDVVWYLEREIPEFNRKIPIAGFEIETSWRTRKHIKGDIFNLQLLYAPCGVVLLLKKGFKDEKKFEGLLKAAREYAKIAGNISVWTKTEVGL